jgi:hypothetical protein
MFSILSVDELIRVSFQVTFFIKDKPILSPIFYPILPWLSEQT